MEIGIKPLAEKGHDENGLGVTLTENDDALINILKSFYRFEIANWPQMVIKGFRLYNYIDLLIWKFPNTSSKTIAKNLNLEIMIIINKFKNERGRRFLFKV